MKKQIRLSPILQSLRVRTHTYTQHTHTHSLQLTGTQTKSQRIMCESDCWHLWLHRDSLEWQKQRCALGRRDRSGREAWTQKARDGTERAALEGNCAMKAQTQKPAVPSRERKMNSSGFQSMGRSKIFTLPTCYKDKALTLYPLNCIILPT